MRSTSHNYSECSSYLCILQPNQQSVEGLPERATLTGVGRVRDCYVAPEPYRGISKVEIP